MLRTPPRLPLAQLPTPIHALQRIELPQANTKIWVKRDDLTGCATSGNKVRKLEFTLAEAKQAGADVIITCGGVQSNHARATAILGAQLGLKVHLLLRGEAEELTGKGNHFLDQLAGATITCYPSRIYVSQFRQLVDDLCAHYREQGLHPYFITTGASDATGGASVEVGGAGGVGGAEEPAGTPAFSHICCKRFIGVSPTARSTSRPSTSMTKHGMLVTR